MLTFHKSRGSEARRFAKDLGRLRLEVFYEFPYLYEGSLQYEEKYLETYFNAHHSFIFLVEDDGRIVGATTSILASEEEESFKRPFLDAGIGPDEVFYFGESVLLPEYRGKGLGKKFFEERETFARTLPFIKYLAFCAVERPSDHPLRPQDYKSLDDFWKQMGFQKADNMKTTYKWKDRNNLIETEKNMQFWIKKIR